ncbi:MAG TPA: hypothetical protein VKT70_04435 [Stellaceae bacterium]|nr:hypothetical protein [Stellaceae bacterium]
MKLGGSLAEAGTLDPVLALLVERCPGQCVIVPGGGLFADAVREGQARYRFGEACAHAMALLAMAQYGLMLADRAPALIMAETLEEIHAALARGGVALWAPMRLVLADPAIPASWDVTSDSLAAWLARKLGARHLVLVKSAPPPEAPSPARLASLGLVDPAFPRFMEGASFPLHYWRAGDGEGPLVKLAQAG